ncbi:MAG: M28 family peptidase [Bacteroidota bacterium]
MLLLAAAALSLTSCKESAPQKEKQKPAPEIPQVNVPVFSQDSAYAYVKKQLSFGPRVPNSPAHRACANWMIDFLKAQPGAKVFVQSDVVDGFDLQGRPVKLSMQNIIASFNPDVKRRIMISAHWDTRPFADEDDERQQEPIPGANDGASGIGVLLELARHLHQLPPNIGVDLFLWDAEDHGNPDPNIQDSYCLGSQYWARNPHIAGYNAMYGINLDMVGAENALFKKEGFSMQYASHIVDKVWKTGQRLGYGRYFTNTEVRGVIDDHLYINIWAKIPCINIIDLPDSGADRLFFEQWHTHDDDLDVISAEPLGAVGHTLLEVVFRE